MYCVRIPNMFFGMKPEKSTGYRLPIEQLSDAELKNKVCEDRCGKRGNCRECPADDMCRVGREMISRRLV